MCKYCGFPTEDRCYKFLCHIPGHGNWHCTMKKGHAGPHVGCTASNGWIGPHCVVVSELEFLIFKFENNGM